MDKLSGQILPLGKAAVALSGGLDSSVLLAICADILGAENCLAVSADTPYMMASEQESADKLCRKIGVKRISVRLSIPDCIKSNPPDRCYLCKRLIFGRLIEEASARGFEKLLDGTNAGDLSDYRPGMHALSELGVLSPFLEAGWGKKEIQECALERGMDVAGKPAYACLMTRFETGARIDESLLKMVDESEDFLRSLGFSSVRVRIHGKCARIEVSPDLLQKFCVPENMGVVSAQLKKIGFKYVSVDLEGYRRGAMNAQI